MLWRIFSFLEEKQVGDCSLLSCNSRLEWWSDFDLQLPTPSVGLVSDGELDEDPLPKETPPSMTVIQTQVHNHVDSAAVLLFTRTAGHSRCSVSI